LYEFDEDQGQPFLVMELLEGEPLSARLDRGPLPVAAAIDIADTMLDALAALHRRGIVHRDLKPANVFLTPHGLKLLDFGLAQPLSGDDQTRQVSLTGRNVVVGTPQYMAPEQLFEGRVDERADIFAAGVVVYEMLSGRSAFAGPTLPATLHAVGYEEPPVLEGSPEIEKIDQVLRKALAKKPTDRFARSELFAAALRETIAAPDPRPKTRATRTRFVAVPLRVLRPDPETDFLAFSIPDAVSVALSTLESVIVRSPQAANPTADVRAIGRDLAVDVVLTGTLLRAGSHVRVSAQLADAEAGTLIWSDVAQAPIEDLFQLQDTLTSRILSSLSVPLTARDRQSLDRHAPASAEAYELYLRANELARSPSNIHDARELYERALEIDPQYAPAWAALGRTRRVIAKWTGKAAIDYLPLAEAAFRRALELDPDLSIAHDLAAYVDVELGRAPEAMERLLRRAATRRTDTGVLAGLVTTCRYAGLFAESKAAHDRAVMLDPARKTSVSWTHFMLGEYDAAIRTETGTPPYCSILAKMITGQLTTAAIREEEERTTAGVAVLAVGAYRAAFEGNVEGAIDLLTRLHDLGFTDPEGWYIYAFVLARAGAAQKALELLTRSIEGGYCSYSALASQPAWDILRGDPAFKALVDRTATMFDAARRRFESVNGADVLTSRVSPSSQG
jgi:non-specific serine/threonine protein kinase